MEGDLRDPRDRDGPLRGRRECHRGHHPEDGLAWPRAIARRLHHRRRPALRLRQRLPRRGQLDRHRGVDAGPDAAPGRGVGRRLQLRRRLRLRRERGDHGGPGRLGREFYVPYWVILAAHAAIGLGTLAGGWRIVKTMGMRITKLRPVGGFSAETAGAVTLIGTAIGGIPVSTTHTISGSIMGVGAISRFSAVRWGVAGRIVSAWIFTIPAAALVSAVAWLLLRPLPL